MLKTYLRFYRFLLVYKWQYALFAISLVVFSVANAVQPYFYKLFVDAIPSQEFDLLFKILLGYIGIRVLKVVFDISTYFWGDVIAFQAGRDARLAVFKKVQDLDFAFHLSKSTGSLISAFKRGDSAFFNLFQTLNINLIRILINLVVVVWFLNGIRWEIGALMGGTFLVNFIVAFFLVKLNVKRRSEYNESEDEISGLIVDNMINYETVKLFAKEDWEYNRMKKSFKNWMHRLWRFANTFRMIDVSVGTLGNAGLFLMLMFSLQKVSDANFTIGEFVLVLGLVSNFYPQFFDLIYRMRDIAKNYTDLEKYLSILDEETLIKDPIKPLNKMSVVGEIEFRNVTFTYPDSNRPSLRNFSLRIRQGQSVALVGKSGVGKTTVVKLLMRFYDVDEGEILVDGVNIKSFTKSQLRSFMGVVPQEPVLFNNSVEFNIAYGISVKNKQQIKAAAKMAMLDKFINRLPKKFKTPVGERGVKLSGGQKQRLAIARMILADPDIIVFDEATSQLDSASEAKIQEAFWKASKNKTTIIIAHRLSTIVKADQIVVMKNGKVAEKGSHHALINQSRSLYKKFWDLQVNK